MTISLKMLLTKEAKNFFHKIRIFSLTITKLFVYIVDIN